MLTRSSNHTLTEQLAERFAERIRSRLLPAGARLPSVRECARQQGVSPYTVVAAYDQKAELWLAPDMGYLPVRIKITQANGDFADLRLRSSGPP